MYGAEKGFSAQRISYSVCKQNAVRVIGLVESRRLKQTRILCSVVAPSLVGGAGKIFSSPTKGDATQKQRML